MYTKIYTKLFTKLYIKMYTKIYTKIPTFITNQPNLHAFKRLYRQFIIVSQIFHKLNGFQFASTNVIEAT